jgi:hypothetical protein
MTLAWQRRAAHLLCIPPSAAWTLPCAEGRERAIGNDGQECLCRAGSVACLPALHAAIALGVNAITAEIGEIELKAEGSVMAGRHVRRVNLHRALARSERQRKRSPTRAPQSGRCPVLSFNASVDQVTNPGKGSPHPCCSRQAKGSDGPIAASGPARHRTGFPTFSGLG